MIVLRNAEVNDFKTYKRLFEDPDLKYQWLYINTSSEDHTDNLHLIGDDFSKLFTNYSIQQFETDLSLEDNYILMIEDESGKKKFGYITLFYAGHGMYKISEWAMFNPSLKKVKSQTLNYLLTKKRLPNFRGLVITTVNDEAVRFLKTNGFSKCGAAFYKREITKQTGKTKGA